MAACFSKVEIEKHGITVNEDFQENTKYCDCVPLTEFDETGDHKWKIKIVMHDVSCCKAEYSCREGYEMIENSDVTSSRFCLLQNNWNYTEPECTKIDTSRVGAPSTILMITIPSSLLVLFFIGLGLFVKWWRRKAKHHAHMIKINSQVEIIHEALEAKLSQTLHDQEKEREHHRVANAAADNRYATAFVKNGHNHTHTVSGYDETSFCEDIGDRMGSGKEVANEIKRSIKNKDNKPRFGDKVTATNENGHYEQETGNPRCNDNYASVINECPKNSISLEDDFEGATENDQIQRF